MELPVEKRVKVLDLLPCDDDALTIFDYNDILSALARAGDHATVVALFRTMPVAPDAQFFATAVPCLCRQGAPDKAKLALDEMVVRVFGPSVATFSAVVGFLCKRGRVTKAMEVLDAMHALCDRGRACDALQVLVLVMIVRDFVPGRNAFEALLGELSQQGRWADAMAVYAAAVKRGVVVSWQHLGREALSSEEPIRLGVLISQ